ncbi:hypothetical protein [Oceanospirillum sediminis]|uniref:Uncharacterized protein n=1 Tax=Oceanospirillum sediminis TaxID=2760088 RepID=A0A839IQN3_9GAMM|nr:hypothetical protein [Oceanospirillum sediminis]MBB1487565.1 hypothetical protein [Oceanospirillum sediminis]
MPFIRILSVILLCATINACSTREATEQFRGSTSQRLLTYSINNLMAQLPEEDFKPFAGQPVYVRSHFIEASQTLNYTTQRLYLELTSRLHLNLVDSPEKARYELDFFFTSLGTDNDVFGLTIPVFWVGGEQPSLDILAVRMYHGVSEMYYYSKDKKTGIVTPYSRILNRTRTDRFATPFFSFPVDDLDEKSLLD